MSNTSSSSSASSSFALAGDDVGALVIDIGGHTSRIGYAGEDGPKQVWNSCAGKPLFLPDDSESNELVYPLCFHVKKEGIEVKPCIYARGKQKYVNEDVFETIISIACEGVSYRQRTKYLSVDKSLASSSSHSINIANIQSIGEEENSICAGGETFLLSRYRFGSLGVNLKEHPVLLTEPTKHSRALREKMVEILFEKFDVPATYLAKHAVLSAFAVGRASGLIVDIGASGMCLSHVTDGYALQKSIMEFPVGGDCLDMQFSHLLAERKLPIYPIYGVKKVTKEAGSGGGHILDVKKIDITQVHPSYLQYSQYETVRKLKEAICRIAEDEQDIKNAQIIDDVTNTNNDMNNVINNNTNLKNKIVHNSTKTYSPAFLQQANLIQYKELPDGTKLNVECYMHSVPEILFMPSLIRCSNEKFLKGYKGLPYAISECIHKCDVDLRRDLLNAIILTGGTSLIPGLSERVSRELQDNEKLLGNAVRFRVVSPSTSIERRFSSWIGGSILASLGSFQQMWISNEEYKEHGTLIAERKCA